MPIPIIVINLERSEERRQFMEAQLQRLGLAFEVFKAVDGSELTPDDLALYSHKRAIREMGRELTPEEIGCSLSHARVWQRMLDMEHDEMLILEDDVLLGQALPDILDVRHKLPAGWDMINLSTDVKLEPFGDPLVDIYRAAHPEHPVPRTSAYLLKLKGARKLLAQAYPIRLPADGLTGRTHLTNLNHYAIYPRVATLADVKSDIGVRLSSAHSTQLLWLDGFLRLVGQYRPLFYFGVTGAVALVLGLFMAFVAARVYQTDQMLALVYALISALLIGAGVHIQIGGVILHSLRGHLLQFVEDRRGRRYRDD